MSSVPLAALNVRPPQQQDLLGDVGRMVQLKSLLQGQQFNQLTLEQAQEQRAEAQRLQAAQRLLHRAYQEGKGDPSKVIPRAIQLGVPPELIQGYEAALEKSRKDYAATKKDELEILIKRQEARSNAFGAFLRNVPPEQRAQVYPGWAQSLVQGGIVPPQQMPAQYPGDTLAQVITTETEKDLDRMKFELERKKARGQERADFEDWYYPAWLETTGKKKNAANEIKAMDDFRKWKKGETPGVHIPFPPEVEAQKRRIAQAGKQPSAGDIRNRETETVELTARDYLKEAKDNPDQALARFEQDLREDQSTELVRLAAKIRQRIREMVRPGTTRKPDRVEQALEGVPD